MWGAIKLDTIGVDRISEGFQEGNVVMSPSEFVDQIIRGLTR